MSSTLIETQNISLSFNNHSILEEVSIAVHSGEIVTVIGPNGAGKTSLVRIVLGLQKPSTGNLFRKHGLTIGYMPQKLQFDLSMPLSVRRFMRLSLPDNKAINSCLALTGVEHLANFSMHTLSGGETQRVLLARALLRNPDLLVLDEPVQGVDVAGQSRLYQLIADIRAQKGCAVLMVSHDLHLVMASTDTVICLDRHVCCHGHPETVTGHPAYLELFGHNTPTGIAVYTHHHDHSHDGHDDINNNQEGHHHA